MTGSEQIQGFYPQSNIQSIGFPTGKVNLSVSTNIGQMRHNSIQSVYSVMEYGKREFKPMSHSISCFNRMNPYYIQELTITGVTIDSLST